MKKLKKKSEKWKIKLKKRLNWKEKKKEKKGELYYSYGQQSSIKIVSCLKYKIKFHQTIE